MKKFTQNWTLRNIKHWDKWLKTFINNPNIHGLEIGCFEGCSSCWFCENILIGENNDLTCIDSFLYGKNTELLFDNNVKGLPIIKLKGDSSKKMSELISAGKKYHFIYIDGGHSTQQVLMDLCFAWHLILPGHIIFCDDYQYPKVKEAIKFRFLNTYRDQIITTEVVDTPCKKFKQIAIWKK